METTKTGAEVTPEEHLHATIYQALVALVEEAVVQETGAGIHTDGVLGTRECYQLFQITDTLVALVAARVKDLGFEPVPFEVIQSQELELVDAKRLGGEL